MERDERRKVNQQPSLEEYLVVYSKYRSEVWWLAYVCCYRDKEAADDISQDTFLRMWAAWERFTPLGENERRAYLLRTAGNLVRDRKKSAAVRRSQPFDPQFINDTNTSPKRGPLEELENQELGEEIRREISALKDRYRFVIVWKILFNRSYAAIAQELGCTKSAARKLLHRGLTILSRRLEHHDPVRGHRQGKPRRRQRAS